MIKKNIELEKLKQMPAKDRPWYIWEYYKIPILGILLLLFILVTLVPSVLKKTETVLTVYILNNPVHEDGCAPIKEGFMEYAGIDAASQNIDMDASMSIDAGDTMAYGYEYIMKITVVMAAGDLDILLTDASLHEYYVAHGAYTDLEKFLPREILAKYGDRLLYRPDEDGISRAFGLDVTDSPVLQAANLPNSPVYFGILSNSRHPEMDLLFLEYLLDGLE